MVWFVLLGSVEKAAMAAAFVSSFFMIAFWMCVVMPTFDDPKKEEAFRETMRPWARKFSWIAGSMIILASFAPSRRDLVESYAMAEAGNLVTSENATAVVTEVMKRVDALLGKF